MDRLNSSELFYSSADTLMFWWRRFNLFIIYIHTKLSFCYKRRKREIWSCTWCPIAYYSHLLCRWNWGDYISYHPKKVNSWQGIFYHVTSMGLYDIQCTANFNLCCEITIQNQEENIQRGRYVVLLFVNTVTISSATCIHI